MNECEFDDQQEQYLKALKILEKDSQPTQRSLSKHLNLSLGKINFIIKSLIEKGWIKANRFKNSNCKSAYLYYLTPKGMDEKANLTRNFLKRKNLEFEQIRQEIESLEAELENTDSPDPKKP